MSDPGNRFAIRSTDTFAVSKALHRWVVWRVWYQNEGWQQELIPPMFLTEQEAEVRAAELLRVKE